MSSHHQTLSRRDYTSAETYELERQRIFHRGWIFAGRSDRLKPGNRTTIDIAGESVLLTRDLDGTLHAFANVCRHRGSRLCDGPDDSTQGTLMCPYHAWTYRLDGRLVATPHLSDDEIDRGSLPLWRHHLRTWAGFVLLSLAAEPPEFDDWLHTYGAQLVALQRYGFGNLEVAVTTTTEVAANWKIIIENYQECLHCARVHPELTELVPTYRTGWVYEQNRDDGGVTLSRGNSFGFASDRELPLLPGIVGTDITSYFGGTGFPNMFIDVTGTSAIATTLLPSGPASTTVIAEYLFAPSTIASPDFDPTPIVQFSELVGAQDNLVCERVQRGVSSRSFTTGVLSAKDDEILWFYEMYHRAMAG